MDREFPLDGCSGYLHALSPYFTSPGAFRKKDVVLIRVGLLLIAAIIFTIKYYYHIAPIEVTMATAGLLLTGVAYALSVYLKEPKYGFSMKDHAIGG